MKILVVGNILKDVYLGLDFRSEQFEQDKNGDLWLDFGFNASQHHYFSRMSSFGGAAITLEVLQKMGFSASVADTNFRYEDGGPVMDGPTGTYRYILTADNGVSYIVPVDESKTNFTTPSEPVDYLYIDRSARLTPTVVDKIVAYLDYYKKTKLVLYLKNIWDSNLTGLAKRADVVFLEGDFDKNDVPYLDISKEKIIRISESSLSYLELKENIVVSRIDRMTHLSAYTIISATVLGGFIMGKTVEYSLKMAKINVENATLDATLTLDEIESIATSTSESNLEMIASTMMQVGKGILAADESGGSIKKKFEALGIADTFQNRHDYREILLSTPGMEKYVTGVILFDETARDTMDEGILVPDYLISRGIVPGVKVDKGLVKVRDKAEVSPEETITDGLADLSTRVREYYQMGLRFTKWRAAFEIKLDNSGAVLTPSMEIVKENCRILAEYAYISQSAGLVPIVEPEVVYDGAYDIDTCARVSGEVLDELFKALERHGVNLRACILKCNMILAGKQFEWQSSPEEVGKWTAKVLKEHVPADLAGVVFLSGGQGVEQATANLAAVIQNGPFPWPVTFSFSRALQGPALETWAGNNSNASEAQKALTERLLANTKVLKELF